VSEELTVGELRRTLERLDDDLPVTIEPEADGGMVSVGFTYLDAAGWLRLVAARRGLPSIRRLGVVAPPGSTRHQEGRDALDPRVLARFVTRGAGGMVRRLPLQA
jgi:hypothetical protein